jgi:hypothetical protein
MGGCAGEVQIFAPVKAKFGAAARDHRKADETSGEAAERIGFAYTKYTTSPLRLFGAPLIGTVPPPRLLQGKERACA